jgi:hypothetical protein
MSTVARLASLTLIVLAGAVSASPAYARGITYRRLCATKRCQLLAVTPQAEVIRATGRRPADEEYEESFARLRGRSALVRLGDEVPGPTTGIRLRALALAGATAGYALRVQGNQTPSLWYVYRLNVATRHREKFAAGPGGETQFPALGAGVFQIAALSDGTVAWTVGGADTAPTAHALMELPAKSSQPLTIANDPGLQLRSLAITPGYLYWTDDQTPHSRPVV